MRLERLTYVHDGDPGVIGQLISKGSVRFGGEGSGLIELERPSSQSVPLGAGGPGYATGSELSVRILAVKFSALPNDVQAELGQEQVPCILGHSGVSTVVLLPARSLARMTGGLSDLRGKIRFGLARIGWEL